MSANPPGSILAVDFGNVHTRAVLIDLVDGVYRLVAQAEALTTAGFPAGDVGVGMRRALDQISRVTNRRLQHTGGGVISPEMADRSGVDTFLATASIGRPLRTVLVGLVPTVSIASGLRAIAGTYVDVVETLSLDDRRDEEAQINAIAFSRPDLIFMTGGTEHGARAPVLKLAGTVALAVSLMTNQRPPSVLYAGNQALAADVQRLFQTIPNTSIFIAPNVRPTLDVEDLEPAQLQLALAFDASSVQRGAGFDAIGSESRLGILPTSQSYRVIVDFLGRARDSGALAVDVGSAVATLAASYGGRSATAIRTDLGLGHSAPDLIEAVGLDAVRVWIPFYVSDDDLRAYAMNKRVRPSVVPETIRELYLEHALLRAAVRALAYSASATWDRALADGVDVPLPPFGQIIGAGAALARTGRPALAAMLLLDALGPEGVTELYADPAGVMPALGAVAHVNPTAVVQLLDSGGLERLGVAFSLGGAPRVGRRAMQIKITPSTGALAITHDVDGGHLWVYPLPAGARATVEIRVRGGNLAGRKHLRTAVEGGSAGLIFDARGRPLPLAEDLRARATQLPLWLSEATGDALRAIDPGWLVPAAEAVPVEAEMPSRDERRARRERRARERTNPERLTQTAERSGKTEDIDDLRDLLS